MSPCNCHTYLVQETLTPGLMSLEARLLLNFAGFFQIPSEQPKQGGSSCSQIGEQRQEVLCWKEPCADPTIDEPEPVAGKQVPTARETCSSAGSSSPSSRYMEASPPTYVLHMS